MDYHNMFTAIVILVLAFIGGGFFTKLYPNVFPTITSFYKQVKTVFRLFISKVADHLDGTPDGRWDKQAAIAKIEALFHKQLDDLSIELRIKFNQVLEEFKNDISVGIQNKDDKAFDKAVQVALEKIKVIAENQTNLIIADAKTKLTEEANAIKDIAVDTVKQPQE